MHRRSNREYSTLMSRNTARTSRIYPYMLAFYGGLLSIFAHADTLYLNNGDKITGTLVQANDSAVLFTTEYAGDLTVSRDHIRAVSTDSSRVLQTDTGDQFEGRLEALEGEQFLIHEDTFMPMPIPAITLLARDVDALTALTDSARKKWSGFVDAGTSIRSGTTDTLDAHTAVTLKRKYQRNTLTLNLGGAYGEVDSEIDTRRAKATVKWRHLISDRLFVFALAGAEHDAGRKLELRANTAAGLGYQFIDQEDQTLSLSAGLDYTRDYWDPFGLPSEEEQAKRAARSARRDLVQVYLNDLLLAPYLLSPTNLWRTAQLLGDLRDLRLNTDTTTEDEINIRLSGDYERRIFAESRISEELVLFTNVSEFGEIRVTSDLALTTPLKEGLNVRLSLLTEYDSDPEVGRTEKVENTFLASLRYEF